MRAFSMALHFLNPRSYRFLRNKFANNMPHPLTITQWYRYSDLDTMPGTVGKKALEAIKLKAKSMEENNEQLLVSLSFDEVAIQRNMVWCRKTNRFIGLIDYGKLEEDNEFTLAKNVIVFMACGLNANFEQPIAFYFIRNLDAVERADLVTKVISELTEHDIKISNMTFDGLSANGSMCEILGANFHGPDYKTYIVNPSDKSNVFIIFDPSHMIKLIRNTFGGRKILYSGEDEILWQYIVDLVNYSKEKSYGLTHKLTKRHIEFADRKMHVRTAVETLSRSTADSLEFLRAKGIPEFVNSAPTIKFIRIFDNLFNVMDTQHLRKYCSECIGSDSLIVFKNALNPDNYGQVYKFLMEAKDYILSIEILNMRTHKKIPIVKSNCKTGFRGFVINIISVINMYQELIEKHHWLTFLMTYRMSQDHLELFFGTFIFFIFYYSFFKFK